MSLEFRRVLGRFATGVTIVTTRGGDGRPLGLTVNAFSSVSLEPPLVLICVDRRSEANAGIAASGLFNVSVLAEEQEEISRRFAAHGTAKFRDIELAPGRNGMPVIPGAIATLECRRVAAHTAGDHLIQIGEVTEMTSRPGRPLLYFGGAYRRLTREVDDRAP